MAKKNIHDLIELDIDDNGHQGAQYCCPYCLVYVWGKVVMVPEAGRVTALRCSECSGLMIAWDGHDNIIETPKEFESSFQGDLYVRDPETWEQWLKTGELKYLRKVEVPA